MSDYADVPDLPGYISVEEAAKRLGVSKTRIYKHINENRLPAVKAARTYMIPIEEIENYRPNITGRPRKSTPVWRIPPRDNDLQVTIISVMSFPGKIDQLKKRLEEIKLSGDFIFPGTIARYVARSKTQPGLVEIELVWKGAIRPGKAKQEQQLEAFKRELADVLDWSTARYEEAEVLLHT